MQLPNIAKQNITRVSTALVLLIASSAALQAQAWCVQNGTKSDDGVTLTAIGNFGSDKNVPATKTLKANDKTCVSGVSADDQTSVTVNLTVAPGKFGCPVGSAACAKVCANDPSGSVKLLGKVDLIINAAKADNQSQWKAGDLIVDYVYNDGKSSPDRYSFACKDKPSAAANRLKP